MSTIERLGVCLELGLLDPATPITVYRAREGLRPLAGGAYLHLWPDDDCQVTAELVEETHTAADLHATLAFSASVIAEHTRLLASADPDVKAAAEQPAPRSDVRALCQDADDPDTVFGVLPDGDHAGVAWLVDARTALRGKGGDILASLNAYTWSSDSGIGCADVTSPTLIAATTTVRENLLARIPTELDAEERRTLLSFLLVVEATRRNGVRPTTDAYLLPHHTDPDWIALEDHAMNVTAPLDDDTAARAWEVLTRHLVWRVPFGGRPVEHDVVLAYDPSTGAALVPSAGDPRTSAWTWCLDHGYTADEVGASVTALRDPGGNVRERDEKVNAFIRAYRASSL